MSTKQTRREELYNRALEACALSYAPYSNVNVGAVALLDGGDIVSSANYENCSSPISICAEQALLCTLNSQHHGEKVEAIAVAAIYKGTAIDITPCGKCRQALLEFANNQKSDIEIVFSFDKQLHSTSTYDLLPFSFNLSL